MTIYEITVNGKSYGVITDIVVQVNGPVQSGQTLLSIR